MKVRQGFSAILFLCFSCAILVCSSCGKVSQDVQHDKDPIPTFSLTYSVPILPTANVIASNNAAAIPSASRAFTYTTTTVYAVVSAVKTTDLEPLNWGRGTLLIESKIPTGPPTFSAVTYDRGNVRISKPDYQLPYISVVASPSAEWTVQNARLKQNYPAYLIQFYAASGPYALKVLDTREATGDVKLGSLTPYDTFIALLVLSDFNKKTAKSGPLRSADLTRLLTPQVFAALHFQIPPNTVSGFTPDRPVFQVKSPLIENLLQLYYLSVTDQQEALNYLQNPPSDSLLSAPARNLLIQILKSL